MTAKPFPNSGYTPPKVQDPRNFVYEKAVPLAAFPDTYKTDLTGVGVYNQQEIPDCVENAVTKAKQYHIFKVAQVVVDLSRRFLAYNTVKADGFPISYGTSLLNALKSGQKQGISESQYFLDDHNLDEDTFSTTPPSAQAVENAKTHTISSYAFLSDFSEAGLKHAIYQNGFVIVGLKLDKSWWSDTNGNITWNADKILPLRIPTDKASISGHACILYAYDQEYFYVWNSFGPEWGQYGHGWFGKEYLPYIYECAVITDLTPTQIQQAQQASDIVKTIQEVQTVEDVTSDPLVKNALVALIQRLWQVFKDVEGGIVTSLTSKKIE